MSRGKVGARIIALFLTAFISPVAWAQLDSSCVINILNRTIQVAPDGSWAMPNVPTNMGQVRARANCVRNGVTTSGQSDYFSLVTNAVNETKPIRFDNTDLIPVSLSLGDTGVAVLSGKGSTLQLLVTASFANKTQKDVTASTAGTNYSSTNPAIATVSANGLVTAMASGNALITVRKDGVVVVKQVNVVTAGDADSDGIPDDYELANGLNPNDPVDAAEDHDGDGLTAKQEYQHGTNIRAADSDADSLSDGEEVVAGADGYVTNPLAADTDGDGLSDALEKRVGSDPTLRSSRNLAAAIAKLSVTPELPVLVFNTIDTESSLQLKVTATLVDGATLDLTAKSEGTNYNSSNLTIASFGLDSGRVFGGLTGVAKITVGNSGHTVVANMTVMTFEPKALSFIDIPGYANNVEVQGDYAYIAAGSAGLQVVDVTDRTKPKIVAALDTPGIAIDVRIAGTTLYLADGVEGLQIVDISNPLQPTRLGGLDTPGTAQDLQVSGNHVYIADGEAGLQIVDVTDPALPLLVGDLGQIGNAAGVDVSGTTAVVVGYYGLSVVNVAELSSPSRVGVWRGSSSKDVVTDGNYAYVAAYDRGYYVIDIRDRMKPTLVAGNLGNVAPRDVEVRDGYAFFAEQLFPNVIAYVNVKDPAKATFQGIINLASLGDYAGTGISLDHRFAYVTEESYAVWTDYLSVGSTRLFIAQYRYEKQDTGSTSPSVTVSSGATGRNQKQGENVKFVADARDDIGVAAVAFFVNGEAVSLDTTYPFEYIHHVDEGATSLTVSAWAVDFGWNIGKSIEQTMSVDPNSRPMVTLVQPANGAEVIEGGTLQYSAAPSDADGISYVEFFFNGEVVQRVSASSYSYSYRVPTTFDVTTNVPVSVRAYDKWGAESLTASASVTVTPDPLPTVTVLSPANNDVWIPGSQRQVKVHVVDNAQVSRAELYSEGSYWYSSYVNVSSADVTFNYWPTAWDAQRGSTRFFVRVYDNLGQMTQSSEILVIVPPNNPPKVTLTSPASGATVTASTKVHLSADASDDGGVYYVYFSVAGNYAGEDYTPPFELDYAIPGFLSGNYSVRAVAYDRLWAYASSNERQLTVVPGQLPVVQLIAPIAGTTVSAGSILNFTANATDPDPLGEIRYVQYFVNGELRSNTYAAPWNSNVLFIDRDVGTATLKARAYDLGGSFTDSTSVTIQVTPDTPPTVSVISPLDGSSAVSGTSVRVRANITDNGPSIYAYVYINNVYTGARYAPPFEWLIAVPPINTTAEIRIDAYDYFGKKTSRAIRVTVVADQPPTVAISAPAADTRLMTGSTVTFEASASDDVGVSWVDFYRNGVLLRRDAIAPYAIDYTVTAQDGTNTAIGVFAIAYDNAGKSTNSASVSYQVDSDNPPSVQLIQPNGPTSIIVGDSVFLSATAQDDLGVKRVLFFSNGGVIAVDYDPPYEYTYTPASVGWETIAALAEDYTGHEAWSAAIGLEVKANQPPAVTLNLPSDGTQIFQDELFDLAATASDDSAVDRVEFFADGAPIGVATGAPYVAQVRLSALGARVLSARAYDRAGLFTDSVPVTVTIIANPGTELYGRVVDESGTPLPGVFITASVGGETNSAGDGMFVLQHVVTTQGDIVVSARTVLNNIRVSGKSAAVTPNIGGRVDVGTIMLRSAPVWNDVIDLDGAHPAFPFVLIDASGHTHTVWTDHGTYSSNGHSIRALYYKMEDITGRVMVGKTLLADDSNSPYKPTIVIDPQQRLHVLWNAWTCGADWCWGKGSIYHTMFDISVHPKDGSPLDVQRDITVSPHAISAVTEFDPTWVSAAADADGNLHVVWRDAFYLGYDWTDSANARVRYVKLDASTGAPLVAEQTLSEERTGTFPYAWLRTSPALTVDNSARVHVMWPAGIVDDNDNYVGQLQYMQLDAVSGAVRVAETTVDSRTNTQFSPASMLMDESGKLHVATAMSYPNEDGWIQHPLYLRLNPTAASQDGSASSAQELNVLTPVVIGPPRHNGGNYMPPALARTSDGELHLVWIDNMWALSSDINYQQLNAVTGAPVFSAPAVIGSTTGRQRDSDYFWNVGTSVAVHAQTGALIALWSDRWTGAAKVFTPDDAAITAVLKHTGEDAPLANTSLSARTVVGSTTLTTDSNGRFTLDRLALGAGASQLITLTDAGALADWVATVRVELNAITTTDLGTINLVRRPHGVIDVIAGVGYAGSGPAGNAGNATALSSPEGVTVGNDSSIYIADTANYRVLRIDSDGLVSTVAGTGIQGSSGDGGPAADAQFIYPTSLATRPDGALFIADFFGDRIRRVDANGTIETVAGPFAHVINDATGETTETWLGWPYDMAFGSDGTMFVSSFYNASIYAFRPDGSVHLVAGNGQSGGYAADGSAANEAQLNGPRGLAIGPDGALYFAESFNNRIRRIDAAGVLTTVAGMGDLDPARIGDDGIATNATFYEPYDIAFGSDGSMFISDAWHYRIRQVMPDGTISTLAGTGNESFMANQGDATALNIGKPAGIAVAPDGSVYFTDQGNHNVWRVRPKQ